MAKSRKFDNSAVVKRLEQLAENAKALHGKQEVPVRELLSAEFLANNTKFRTVEEFFGRSKFTISSPEDLKSIPDSEWDAYVKETTKFSTWRELIRAAGGEWARKRLLG